MRPQLKYRPGSPPSTSLRFDENSIAAALFEDPTFHALMGAVRPRSATVPVPGIWPFFLGISMSGERVCTPMGSKSGSHPRYCFMFFDSFHSICLVGRENIISFGNRIAGPILRATSEDPRAPLPARRAMQLSSPFLTAPQSPQRAPVVACCFVLGV